MRVWLAIVMALTAVTMVSPAAAPAQGVPSDQTGRVVIGYSSARDASSVRSRVANSGARVGGSRLHRACVATPPTSMTSAEFIARMKRVPGVAYAEPERVMHVSYVPNDPMYAPYQWAPRRIGAEAAWDVQRATPSVSVAVVDTGVDYAHPDLVGRIDSINATDVIDGGTAQDLYGHGTHVAGIIAANANNAAFVAGIAPSATVMPVRVLDAQGSGTDAGVAAGIEWAADHGADVINLSLGGSAPSSVLAQACAYARAKDCVIVAASGNAAASPGWVWGAIEYPAAYPGVLSVGAVDANDTRAPFSEYGPDLDLVAPGVNIRSLYPGQKFADLQGTSMATPHVAAVAALLRSQNPTWTAVQVEQRLIDTSEDLGAAGKDYYFGNGLVRADLALGVGTPPAPRPSDNVIPGSALGPNPVVESLDASTDQSDVYSVLLGGGETLRASIQAPGQTDFGLRVFSKDATSVTDLSGVVAATPGGAYPRELTFTAPPLEGGTYYVQAFATSGAGQYSATWQRGYLTTLTAAAPSTVAWGGSTAIRGTITEAAGPVSDAFVTVEALPAGAAAWIPVAYGVSDPAGAYSVSVRPARQTRYRVSFAGGGGYLPSTSAETLVTPRAHLTTPSAPTYASRTAYFTSAGLLLPRHTAGHCDVKLYCYRLESGAWKLRKTEWARNADYYSYSRYSARLLLPSAGRWMIVARIGGDAEHATTYSAPRYLSVR